MSSIGCSPGPDGRPTRFPDHAFKNAVKTAGRPNLRCTTYDGVSRTAELGVLETDARELLGMETGSIFSRYTVEGRSEGARKDRAVERMAGALDAEPKRREVAGITGKTRV